MITIVVSFQVDAPAATVWDLVGDPAMIAAWHPAIVESSCDGDQRTCVLPDGNKVHERMRQVDGAARVHEYSFVAAPFPIQNHTATFRVRESGPKQCVVDWSCTFETSGGAPEAPIAASMRDVYVLGLEALRARLAP